MAFLLSLQGLVLEGSDHEVLSMPWPLLTCGGKGEPQVHRPNEWGPDHLHRGDP